MARTIVEVYKDSYGEWRWRMNDFRNKKIIAASTEGYKRKSSAIRNLDIHVRKDLEYFHEGEDIRVNISRIGFTAIYTVYPKVKGEFKLVI